MSQDAYPMPAADQIKTAPIFPPFLPTTNAEERLAEALIRAHGTAFEQATGITAIIREYQGEGWWGFSLTLPIQGADFIDSLLSGAGEISGRVALPENLDSYPIFEAEGHPAEIGLWNLCTFAGRALTPAGTIPPIWDQRDGIWEADPRPLTALDLARKLGKSPRQIRYLASTYEIGSQMTDGTWAFTERDIERIQGLGERRGRKPRQASNA